MQRIVRCTQELVVQKEEQKEILSDEGVDGMGERVLFAVVLSESGFKCTLLNFTEINLGMLL